MKTKISIPKELTESIEKFAPKEKSKTAVKMAAKTAPTAVLVEESKKPKIAKTLSAVAVLVVVLGLAATSYYFYHKYKTVPSVETEEIAGKISKFMELPQGEIPTLATVTDKDKMKDQPFFAKSENGDKVLIYTKAQKAVLYRPSANKIIEVMQLSISKPSDASTQQPDPIAAQPEQTTDQAPVATPEQTQENTQAAADIQAKLKVAVYNGSGVKGKAGTVADEILKIEGLEVTQKTNATGSFDDSLIIDLTDSNAEMAGKIAEALGAQVGQLPEGETKPDADILVIAGVK